MSEFITLTLFQHGGESTKSISINRDHVQYVEGADYGGVFTYVGINGERFKLRHNYSTVLKLLGWHD